MCLSVVGFECVCYFSVCLVMSLAFAYSVSSRTLNEKPERAVSALCVLFFLCCVEKCGCVLTSHS